MLETGEFTRRKKPKLADPPFDDGSAAASRVIPAPLAERHLGRIKPQDQR
jgi:hypothetical protein